jgi:hypothetical protein
LLTFAVVEKPENVRVEVWRGNRTRLFDDTVDPASPAIAVASGRSIRRATGRAIDESH